MNAFPKDVKILHTKFVAETNLAVGQLVWVMEKG